MINFSKESMKKDLLKNQAIKKLFEGFKDDFKKAFDENDPTFLLMLKQQLSYQEEVFSHDFKDFFFDERKSIVWAHGVAKFCIVGAVSTSMISAGFLGLSVGAIFMLCAAVIEAAVAIVSLVRYCIAKVEYWQMGKGQALIDGYMENWKSFCEANPLKAKESTELHGATQRFFSTPTAPASSSIEPNHSSNLEGNIPSQSHPII